MAHTPSTSSTDSRTGTATGEEPEAQSRPRSMAYSILVSMASLVVLLQGLWAGLFVHEGQDYQDGWVWVHARGAELAILLALVSTVVAVAKLRSRRDLLLGAALLTTLLVLESYLGGLIGDSPAVTVIHFPLAMALMGLVVWLPFRSRHS